MEVPLAVQPHGGLRAGRQTFKLQAAVFLFGVLKLPDLLEVDITRFGIRNLTVYVKYTLDIGFLVIFRQCYFPSKLAKISL